MKKIYEIVSSVLVAATVTLTAITMNTEAHAQVKSHIDMGWKKVGHHFSYVNASGNKVKGWNRLNGLWYYFNSKGEMVTGIQVINNKIYQFNKNGSLNKVLGIKSNTDISKVIKTSKKNEQSSNSVNVETVKNQDKKETGKVTKKIPGMIYDGRGNALGYGKRYISNASAYTGDTTTASGQRPRWGTIAVDPRVIPLGSRVYVPYFDKVFIANDTGGIIRGTMIDIFMKSSKNMNNFGRRNLEIYVLK